VEARRANADIDGGNSDRIAHYDSMFKAGSLSVADMQALIKSQFETVVLESLEGYASLFISFSRKLADEFPPDAAESVFSEISYLAKSDSSCVVHYGLLLGGCIRESGSDATEATFRGTVGASEDPVHWVLLGPKVADPKFRTRLKRLGSECGIGGLDNIIAELGGSFAMCHRQIVEWVQSRTTIGAAMSDRFLLLYILLCLERRHRLHVTHDTSKRLSQTFTVDDAKRLEGMIAGMRTSSVESFSSARSAKRRRQQGPKSRPGVSMDTSHNDKTVTAIVNNSTEDRQRATSKTHLSTDEPNGSEGGRHEGLGESSDRNTSADEALGELHGTSPNLMHVACTPLPEPFDDRSGGAGFSVSSGGLSGNKDDTNYLPPPGSTDEQGQTEPAQAALSTDGMASNCGGSSSPGSYSGGRLSEAGSGHADDDVSEAVMTGVAPPEVVPGLMTPPNTVHVSKYGSAVSGSGTGRQSGCGDGGHSLPHDPLRTRPTSPSEEAAARGSLRIDVSDGNFLVKPRCGSADAAAASPDQLDSDGSSTGPRTQLGRDVNGDVQMTAADSHSLWREECDRFILELKSEPGSHEHWARVDVGVAVATLVRDLPVGDESDFALVTGSTRIRSMYSEEFMGSCGGGSSSAMDLRALLCVALDRDSLNFRDRHVTVDGVLDELRCRSESAQFPAVVTVSSAGVFGDGVSSTTEAVAFEQWKGQCRGKHHVSLLRLNFGLYMGPSCLEMSVWIYRRAVGHVRATGLGGYIGDADVVDIRPRGYVGRWTSSARQLWTYIRLHDSSPRKGLPACLVVVADCIDGPDQGSGDSVPDGAAVVCLRPGDSIVVPRGKRWFLVVMEDTLVASGNFWPLGDLPAAVDDWRRTVAARGEKRNDAFVGRVLAEYLSSLPGAMVGSAREGLKRLVEDSPRCNCAVGDPEEDRKHCACLLAGEDVCRRSCCDRGGGRDLVDESLAEADAEVEMVEWTHGG